MESRPLVVCVKISSWVRPMLHLPVKWDYLLSIHQRLKENFQFLLFKMKQAYLWWCVMPLSGSGCTFDDPNCWILCGLNWSEAARRSLQTTFVPDYTSAALYLWLSNLVEMKTSATHQSRTINRKRLKSVVIFQKRNSNYSNCCEPMSGSGLKRSS